VSGAKEWVNYTRSLLLVGCDQAGASRRVVASRKCSFAALPPSLAVGFEDVDGLVRVHWLGLSELDADDLEVQAGDRVDRSMREHAREIVRMTIDNTLQGEAKCQDIGNAIKGALISARTMYRAFDDLGAVPGTVGPISDRHRVMKRPRGGWKTLA
jgi:hypothetical protein